MEDYSEKVMPLLSVNAIIVGPVVIDKVEQNGIVRQRAALIPQAHCFAGAGGAHRAGAGVVFFHQERPAAAGGGR